MFTYPSFRLSTIPEFLYEFHLYLPRQAKVAGKLKDVLDAAVDYMNLWKGANVYSSLASVPQTTVDAVWRELVFEK